MPDTREVFEFRISGTLSTSSSDRWEAPFPGQVIAVTADVGTAPTGAALILDVQKNGTTIFTTTGNRPTVAAGQTKSPVSAAPNVQSFAAGDELKLVVAQVGSTVAGADLVAVVEFTPV